MAKTSLESIGKKAKAIGYIIGVMVTVITVVWAGLTVYFASQSDLDSLETTVAITEITDLQDELDTKEERISFLKSRTTLTQEERSELFELEQTHERNLQTLKVLQESQALDASQ